MFPYPGIGIDDLFILISCWRYTSFKLSVEERLGRTLKLAAVSITITSITDALAFGISKRPQLVTILQPHYVHHYFHVIFAILSIFPAFLNNFRDFDSQHLISTVIFRCRSKSRKWSSMHEKSTQNQGRSSGLQGGGTKISARPSALAWASPGNFSSGDTTAGENM